MLSKIALQTPAGESLTDITEQVSAAVRDSRVKEGICVIFAPHTTGALSLNSALDVHTLADIRAELRGWFPEHSLPGV